MRLALLGDMRFIGLAAAEHAVESGHEVTILHTGKHEPLLAGADYRVAAREDPAALRRALRDCRPEVVIDAHAMTEQGASAAVDALADWAPRVVVLSSHDVYAQFGHLLGHPLAAVEEEVSESSPLTVPYPFRGVAEHAGGPDYDKKEVERVYRDAASRFDSVIALRLPATYGRRDTKRRFGWIVDRLDEGLLELPRIAGARWRWTHAHIGDVARAIVAAATASSRGHRVFNLGEAEAPTMGERVELIASRMQREIRWKEAEELPPELYYLGPMPCDFVVDTTLARQALSIEDSAAESCIDDLIDWLRASRRESSES